MSRAAVFLDRDGVLNRAVLFEGRPFPPRSVEELEILPGVPETCEALRSAGFLLIVVTNQPDVARGTTTMEDIGVLNDRLADKIPIDAVLVCPHDDADGCGCRKPKPGLLFEAARRWGIALDRSVMVGDRWRDIAAGRRARCWTVFIDARYAERRPRGQHVTVTSLPEALPWILARGACKRRAATWVR